MSFALVSSLLGMTASSWLSSAAIAATEATPALAMRVEDTEKYGSLFLLFGLTVAMVLFFRGRAPTGSGTGLGRGGRPGGPGGMPPPPGDSIEQFERVRLRGGKGPTKEQLARSRYLRAEYELRKREAEARKAEHERALAELEAREGRTSTQGKKDDKEHAQNAWHDDVSAEEAALKAIEELLDAVKEMSSDVKEESK